MITVNFTFTFDQKTHSIEAHSNELIREVFMKIVRSRPEYYKKLKIKGMTLNGEKIEQDDTLLEVDVRDNDNILVNCELKENIKVPEQNSNVIGNKLFKQEKFHQNNILNNSNFEVAPQPYVNKNNINNEQNNNNKIKELSTRIGNLNFCPNINFVVISTNF